MPGTAILAPDWWNYKPICEEQLVKCYQGKWVDIDFRKYLIQGANPTTERVLMGFDPKLEFQPIDTWKLDRDGSQRGFLNSVKTTSSPVHGVYYKNMEYGKIRYIPHRDFQGIDCFRFVITTPWQSSDEFRVLIEVLPAPSMSLFVHRVNDPAYYNFFKYSAKLINFDPEPAYYYFVWYEFIPTLTRINNRNEVIMVLRLLHQPTYTITGSPPDIVFSDIGSKTGWVERYWPDPLVDRKGYISGTTELYRQPPGPPTLLVRCVTFDAYTVDPDTNLVTYENADEVWADTTQGGYNWWKSGRYIILETSMV